VIEFSSTASTPMPFNIDSKRSEAIRLVVLDIDGTIAGENNVISPSVQKAVRAVREKGIQVAIATGRIHRHWTLAKSTALGLLNYFEQVDFQQHLSVHAYVNDRLYVRAVTPESQLYSDRTGVTLHPVGDLRALIQEHEPTKLLALSLNADHIDSLYTNLRS
jgi:hypothetical protein